MPRMKPPSYPCFYNGQRPMPGALVDVLPQDVAVLEREGWIVAGEFAAAEPISEVVINEESADE